MSSEDCNPRDERVDEAIAEFLEAAEAGRAPDVREFIARHADLATELEAFFADRKQFGQLVQPLMPAPQARGGGWDEPTLAPAQTDGGSSLGTVRYFGDYELLEEIARGGMGVVYKARQVSLKRIVALKMILAGQFAGDDDVRRFKAEAEAAARLDHPNIVPIFEVGQHEGQHYFSMSYVDGESLAHRLSKGVFAPREAAEMMAKIAQAIAYAHVEGVVHRDLKPANILLAHGGGVSGRVVSGGVVSGGVVSGDGPTHDSPLTTHQLSSFFIPKVTDFGLAKRVDTPETKTSRATELTKTGQVLGTPSYMSPEQAGGKTKAIGPPADIYALGAILYAMLTGRPPCQAASPIDTLLQVIDQEPVSPRLLNSQVPRDLETICLKCLQKEPQRRYSSAQELADELTRFVHGEPIHARPVGAAERAWRWLHKQRRSAVVGATAAVAAAILVVAGVAGWRMYQFSQFGHLRLKSEKGQLLVAELLDEHDEPVAPSFTLPTIEPISFPAAPYHVRVSGAGLLSETYLLDIEPRREQSFVVKLGGNELRPALALPSVAHGELMRFGNETDLILLPQDPTMPVLARQSGATGKTVWEMNWSADSPDLAGLLKTLDDKLAWNTLFRWSDPPSYGGPQKLIGAVGNQNRAGGMPPNLDGDGTVDLVWAFWPALVAVSGDDGKPLWWIRPRNEAGMGGTLVGMPLIVACGDGNAPLLAACFKVDQSWIEAFSATTGQSLWRRPFKQGTQDFAADSPNAPQLATLDGKPVIVAAADCWLVGFDAASGDAAWPPFDLGFQATEAPNLADLDGDGQDEAVVLNHPPDTVGGWSSDWQLAAVSLSAAAPRIVWHAPYLVDPNRASTKQGRCPRPLVVDLDQDGKAEIVVHREGGQGQNAFTGVELLDGTTGRPRWTRRFSIAMNSWENMNRWAERIEAGPDVDGDGVRELFMASVRRDVVRRPGDVEQLTFRSVFFDCFSGRDGRSLWWSRVPIEGESGSYGTNVLFGITGFTWWHEAADGWPQLVVSVTREPNISSIYVLSTATGRLLHSGDDLMLPRVSDFDGDRMADLALFTPDDSNHSVWDAKTAGKLHFIRAQPAAVWRRFGEWTSVQEFDGDGSVDLMADTRGDEIAVASGTTGRIQSRWNIEWNWQRPRPGTGRKFMPQAPYADLDGDRTPDLLLTTDSAGDDDGGSAGTGWPRQVRLRLQAISGQTGRRLWLGPSIPAPTWPTSPDQKRPFAVRALDVDDDGRGELLCTWDWEGFAKVGARHEFGFTLVDGSTGALRWTETFFDHTEPSTGRYMNYGDSVCDVSASVEDLDGDRVRDFLLSAPRLDGTTWHCEIQARSGRDGKLLWPPQALVCDANPANHWLMRLPTAIGADIDGDGRAEVVVVDRLPQGDASTKRRLIVLSGVTGETHWTWEWTEKTEVHKPTTFVVADLDGPTICVAVNEGPKPEIVVLDHFGNPRRRISTETMDCAGGDLNGDGGAELLHVHDAKLQAIGRGGDVTWSWPLPAGWQWPVELVDGGPGQPATVVVWTADGIHGLDGRTGEAAWRTARELGSAMVPLGGLRETPTANLLGAGRPDASPLMQLATATRQQTVSRVIVRAATTDEPGPPSRIVVTAESSLSPDPRLLRHLPWVPTRGTGKTPNGMMAGVVLFMGGYTLTVVVLPGWFVIRALRRRRFSLRELLALVAAIAVAFTCFKLFTQVREAIPQAPPLAHLMMAVAGLPGLAFIASLATWTVRRQWRRTGRLLLASCTIALAMAGVLLWYDSQPMDASERYMTDQWYLIWFPAAYLTGLIVVAIGVLGPVVRAMRRWRTTLAERR
jgi:serine/threonine protein kinase